MKHLRIACFFALVCGTSLVHADAPPNWYGQFDSTNTVLTDQHTGLTWTRAVGAPTTYANALLTVCTGTSRIPTLKELLTLVDEHPHREHVAGSVTDVPKSIDRAAFGASTPTDKPYWTSTPHQKSGALVQQAYAVAFAPITVNGTAVVGGGTVIGNSDGSSQNPDKFYVRCVQ